MASTYLTRTPSSAGNQQTWTWSGWVKRGKLGVASDVFAVNNGVGDSVNLEIIFDASDRLTVSLWNIYLCITNAVFRDVNGWYHIVFALDTTQATSTNRFKLYVNGEEITSFNQTNYPSQNTNYVVNSTAGHLLGAVNYISAGGLQRYFEGSMSHINFIDGTAYDASAFGSTDATTGEWKIKTSPSVTYGTNGFFILKDGNSVTDQSGNSNNFTVGGGTLTKTEDSPSSVFATFNPLFLSLPTGGLSNGNTTATTAGADSTWRSAFANLGATSGKYYMEVKWVSGSHFVSGFASQRTLSTHDFKDLTDTYSGGQYFGIYGTSLYTNGSSSGSYTAQASGNIIQLALDMDNKKIYQGINGTWNVGGNPSSGNGISITGDTDEFWTFGISTYSNSGTGEYHANFGNGYFATTAVSSAGTNASGNGIFEYDVPTGYTALSTKGLNL